MKVKEEFRDGKWKTVADAAQAYGVSAQGVRYWVKRLNGILKGGYFLDRHFRTKVETRKAVAEAIWIYNNRRLHEKFGYKTPAAFRAEWKEAS